MLSYDPSRFRLKESCSQCNTYSIPQPPEEPYSRYTANNRPGMIRTRFGGHGGCLGTKQHSTFAPERAEAPGTRVTAVTAV